MRPRKRIWVKGVLIPKLINNPIASCSLRIFEVLLLHSEQLDKNIVLPFLVLTTFGFSLSVFFYTSHNKIKLFYI